MTDGATNRAIRNKANSPRRQGQDRRRYEVVVDEHRHDAYMIEAADEREARAIAVTRFNRGERGHGHREDCAEGVAYDRGPVERAVSETNRGDA